MAAASFVPVHARASAQALAARERTALVCGRERLSYAALEARSNALAHALIRRGAGRETRIGLCLTRSADAFLAILAVLKAGAAYVPLDPDAPPERIAAMAEDASLSLILTDEAVGRPACGENCLARLPAGLPRLVLDAQAEADLFAGPDTPPQVAIHPEQLAYVIFTSGSTGRPKGVAVAHGPLAMHAETIGERYGFTEDDRILHLIALSFDGGTEAWLAAFLHGGCLVVGDPRAWTAEDALAAIRDEGVSVCGMSPALLASIAEAQAARGGSLPVRSWTAGGEAFSIDSFLSVRRAFHPARIINGYGPTEAVITPLMLAIEPDTPPAAWEGADWLPIGTPVGARTAHVLDEGLAEAGIGVPGELYLGGSGLARGYVGRPAETASRFVPDPFGAPGSRLYRTGDRVTRRADGSLSYLGRIDAQVKIRGFRIEPGEVEAQLLSHPGCREAAVVAVTRGRDTHLVAYVSGEADGDALAGHLSARLPEHMRPSRIVVLPALPRLSSGKTDRRALPEPDWGSGSYEAPRTDTERALAVLWGELLGVERVGRADGFFQLGGHSLLAAKLTARIKTDLGRHVGLPEFYAAATLADLAALIDGGDEARTASDIDALLAEWEDV